MWQELNVEQDSKRKVEVKTCWWKTRWPIRATFRKRTCIELWFMVLICGCYLDSKSMRVCGRFTVTLFVSFRRYRAALRKSLNKIRQMFDYPRKNCLSHCTTIQPRHEGNSSLPAPNVPPALQTNNQPQQDLTLVWAWHFLTFAGWNSVEIIMT